jgi:hypothetical protein
MSLSAILLRPPEGAGPPPPAPPKPRVAERPDPPRGTPADAPATRPDLAGEAPALEPAAPAWPATAPGRVAETRPAPEAPKPDTAPPMADALKVLRGQSAPVGALLDRAA